MTPNKKHTLPKTNIAMENPPFWWYLQGNILMAPYKPKVVPSDGPLQTLFLGGGFNPFEKYELVKLDHFPK